MKNWTVKRRIISGFCAVIAIMLALTVVSWFYLDAINDEVISITTDSWPGLYFSSQIESLSRVTLTSFQKFMAATEEEERRQVEAEISSNGVKLDGLMKEYDRTISTDQERQLFVSLMEARAACEKAFKPVREQPLSTINGGPSPAREQVD